MKTRTRMAALAAVALTVLIAAGCRKPDETLTAAPPPASDAKPLPKIENRPHPRPKLPPLVGRNGQRTAGGDF